VPRVLLVIGSLECGGAQRALIQMANHWKGLDWDVTLTTWSGSEVPDFYEVDPRIDRVALTPHLTSVRASRFAAIRSILFRMLRLRRLVATKEPDAVLSFIDVSNVLTILSTVGMPVRIVVSERTNPSQNKTVSPFWKGLRRLTYRWAGEVVVQTSDAARWIDIECGVRSLVIPNGIRRMPGVDVLRAPLILTVGRLSREKGVDAVLRAFALATRKESEWRLVIVGDGPERSALIALRAELNLMERVEFAGQVHDVETWLARAGFVVHASRREGFPNVVLEAMAMGVPVICTDCPSGPSDIIRDRINGRLIPVDDVDALSDAMTELMESRDVRLRLAGEALKVRETYDLNMIMDRWSTVLLGRTRATA